MEELTVVGRNVIESESWVSQEANPTALDFCVALLLETEIPRDTTERSGKAEALERGGILVAVTVE